ncbi:uncharacterized protein LOC119465038 isoform X2 [Dermacentor silvarum]|uniref:uncharacterized protein LOC119465038 isoform X2 n=1 Tax=Dermacentor silvarum TaxID=543639 RepID=UPI0021009C01|nr:uncharacterized protein LOC119465038 isoform X2 [Dermacentor silvarum]
MEAEREIMKLRTTKNYWMDGRPTAKIRMQFSKAPTISPSKILHGFNHVKASTRTHENCAVVKVRHEKISASSHLDGGPNTTGVRRRPQCEVWASEHKTTSENDVEESSKWNLCLAFFYSNCDTRNIFKVYNPEKCKRMPKR